MVIHIPVAVVKSDQLTGKASSALKQLFSLIERKRHEWLLTLDDNPEDYCTPALASFNDIMQNKVVQLEYRKRVTASVYRHGVEDQAMCDQENFRIRFAQPHELEHFVRICINAESVQAHYEQLRDHADVETKLFLDGHRLVAKKDGKTCEFLTLDLVETYLERPLKILVENIDSDSLFIRTCLTLIGVVDAAQLVAENKIAFGHGGGDTILSVARSIEGKERVICIVDSDEVSPGMYNTESKKGKIEELCDELGYERHILRKREIENYIPEVALKRHLGKHWPHYQNYFFFRLGQPHRDYFDMKQGITKDMKHKKWTEETYAIWNEHREAINQIAATSEDKEKLNGFGNKVWEAFHHVQSREELETVNQDNELDVMVHKILRLV